MRSQAGAAQSAVLNGLSDRPFHTVVEVPRSTRLAGSPRSAACRHADQSQAVTVSAWRLGVLDGIGWMRSMTPYEFIAKWRASDAQGALCLAGTLHRLVPACSASRRQPRPTRPARRTASSGALARVIIYLPATAGPMSVSNLPPRHSGVHGQACRRSRICRLLDVVVAALVRTGDGRARRSTDRTPGSWPRDHHRRSAPTSSLQQRHAGGPMRPDWLFWERLARGATGSMSASSARSTTSGARDRSAGAPGNGRVYGAATAPESEWRTAAVRFAFVRRGDRDGADSHAEVAVRGQP